jgi:transketolase
MKEMCSPYELDNSQLSAIASQLRLKVFEICKKAKSGHIGASSAAVELFTVLYFGGILKYDASDPQHPDRDRILVRGHLGPLRYSIFSLLGWIENEELGSYRRLGSRLQGHENHLETPGVDITPSGSLGMLLSYGVGCAVSALNQGKNYKTYVFLGDGEEQEGNVSEAARHAAHLKLPNLIAVIDRNHKQLSDPIVVCDSSDLAAVWRGYGWRVIHLMDGNDIAATSKAFHCVLSETKDSEKPIVLIADTSKGLGLSGAKEHFSGYHTIGVCPNGVVDEAIRTAKEDRYISSQFEIAPLATTCEHASSPPVFFPATLDIAPLSSTSNNPDFCQGDYFFGLGEKVKNGIFKNNPIYFLTADVTRRDQVNGLGLEKFSHYLNVGIREQHMIGMAHGISVSDPSARIIINSFDAFLFRCLDQINAAVQGQSSMLIIADVAGLTNARNGSTHQTTGQSGAALMIPGITFLEPWDALDTFNCLNWAIGESRGVVYLRIHSSSVSIRDEQTKRTIDYYEIDPISAGKDPDAVIVASGLGVATALDARQILAGKDIHVRLINVVNPKSLDALFAEMIPTGRPLITVYNGAPEVLGYAVSASLHKARRGFTGSMRTLGFKKGTTGTLEELITHFQLDGESIARIVEEAIHSE